jgi:uncharacterized protein
MFMRSLALVVIVALAGPAVAQKGNEALAAADRLIQVQDLNVMMADMASGVAKSLPESQRAAFVAEMTDAAFLARYKEKMRVVMAKNFTVEELNALADFYAKPIAKSAMSKMGVTMSEMMPYIQGEMPAMMQRIQQRLQKP